jgi:endoglucanase
MLQSNPLNLLELNNDILKMKFIMLRLLCLTSLSICSTILVKAQTPTARPTESIRLNQIGFYPRGAKIAIVVTDHPEKFNIRNSENETVFSSVLKASVQPDFSGKRTYIADFSTLMKPGHYSLEVPGLGVSYTFEIQSAIFEPVGKGAIKAFYYQRASTELPERYAGKWHRPMGHPDDKVIIHPSAATAKRPTGTIITSPRGWYDAGDYNKYIVNSGISTATLLSLYEDFPVYTKTLKLNIPESSNNVPDILDETLWNLRWMLSMQDPDDGGVYHKLTNAAFDGMVMPNKAIAPRYVVQKSTAATLNFAAVMAQACRIYKEYDRQFPGLADSCRTAAVKAWQWSIANPQIAYDQKALNKTFKPEITTGAYDDTHFTDEFTWAAAELYITTSNEVYLKSINATAIRFNLPSWPQVGTLGYYSLLRNRHKLTPAGQKLIPILKQQLIAFADQLMEGREKTAYNTVIGKSAGDFGWGSNSIAANQGIALLQAYLLTQNTNYARAAMSNLDYLLGRNGTGYSYVSGFGSKPIMHPHHRPSIADGINDPVPGLLSGGPNPGRQDSVALPSLLPNQAFVDNDKAYAVNEIAINWNAPLAYLINALEALEYKSGYRERINNN